MVRVPLLVTATLPKTSNLWEGAVVPMPTLPLSKMANLWVLEESVVKKEIPVPVPAPLMVNLEFIEGAEIPIHTLPLVPTNNRSDMKSTSPATVSLELGDTVPMPTLPLFIVNLDVATPEASNSSILKIDC